MRKKMNRNKRSVHALNTKMYRKQNTIYKRKGFNIARLMVTKLQKGAESILTARLENSKYAHNDKRT